MDHFKMYCNYLRKYLTRLAEDLREKFAESVRESIVKTALDGESATTV